MPAAMFFLALWLSAAPAAAGRGAPSAARDDPFGRKDVCADPFVCDIFGDRDPFAGFPDPFGEFSLVRRRMSRAFMGFDRFFDGVSRAGGGVRTSVLRSSGTVKLVIEVPGLEKKTLDLKIEEGTVSLSYSARNYRREESRGNFLSSESYESYSRVMPVPEGADPETARTSVDGERIVVEFDRKKAKSAVPAPGKN